MKQMNLVELYNYIIENGEATVKTLGYSGIIYDDGDLDYYLQNNFKLGAVFEVYDKSDNEKPFEITGWIERGHTVRKLITICGENIKVDSGLKYYAVDNSGKVFGYFDMPSVYERLKRWVDDTSGEDSLYLGIVNYKGDWKKSLTKI